MNIIHNVDVTLSESHFDKDIATRLKNYGNVCEQVNTWCRINCKGLFRQRRGYATIWQFADPEDAVLFKLFWG